MSTCWWRPRKSQSFTLWPPSMFVSPVFAEIFQSGPKWWTDWQTDQPTVNAIPSATLLAWLNHLYMVALNVWYLIWYIYPISLVCLEQAGYLIQNPSVPKTSLSLFDKMNWFHLFPRSFQDFSRQLYPKLMFLVLLVCLDSTLRLSFFDDELVPVASLLFSGVSQHSFI